MVAAAAVGLEWRRGLSPLLTGQTEERTVREVWASQWLGKAHLQITCTEHPPAPQHTGSQEGRVPD